MTKKVAMLLAGVAAVVAWACQRNDVVYDGFETPGLGEHWETMRFLSGAVQIQSSVVRVGKGAARITLRPGDQIPQERGSELERAELQESRRLWSVEDSAYVYSFSVFVPQDFPIVSTRLVIAQWKQHCPVGRCTPDNPTLAIRYQAGELFIALQVTAEKVVLYRTRDDIRNRWLDFRFQIRFSRSQSGRIKAWLGDTVVVDYNGVTAYPASGGYVGQGLFYFKMGLYRDRSPELMTIYLDEYRKQKLGALGP
jgi:hypothetical protein